MKLALIIPTGPTGPGPTRTDRLVGLTRSKLLELAGLELFRLNKVKPVGPGTEALGVGGTGESAGGLALIVITLEIGVGDEASVPGGGKNTSAI